jgi:hypothetical protein
MELSVSDEPGCVEGGPQEFVLHDLQFLELRVGHVTPDCGVVFGVILFFVDNLLRRQTSELSFSRTI